MSKFKNKMKDHYDKIELSDDQFNKLDKIMRKEKKSGLVMSWFKYFAATAFALVITILIMDPFTGVDEKIMNEVVMNHLKNMPSEIVTTDVTVAESGLNKLDFSLISATSTKDMKLIGARYCSILGKTAAQLSYKDFKGRRFTVYQVPLQKEFRNQTGRLRTSVIKGVNVILYSEDGLLIAKAVSK